MCKGGTANTTQGQSSTVSIPQDILNKYNDIYSQAKQVSSQPFVPYTGQMVAPVNAAQTNAIENITNAQGIQWPFIGNANTQLGSAGVAYGNASGAAAPLNSFAAGLIPASINASSPLTGQQIGQYMSPYNQAVVEQTMRLLNQRQGQQRTDLNTNMIQQGAYGGDRSGIANAVLAGQQNLATGNVVSGLYNQNYQQALAAAQQQQAQRVGALQQGAGLAGNLGNQLFGQGITQGQAYQGLGGAYAGLGTTALNNTLAQGQAQLGAGQLYQQTQQALDTAYYNQFLQQQAYPFQTTQFLANIGEGLGALSGSTTSGYGYQAQPMPFFSDDRLKENVRVIGHTKEGLKIVRYNLKDDPHKLIRLGFLASDVEHKIPEAVSRHAGVRAVDYDRAARAQGGLVTNDNIREGFAQGGGYDPMAMAQMLAAHEAMFPTAAGRPGIGGTGPRGMQLDTSPPRQLMKAEPLKFSEQREEPELQSALREANELTAAGKGIGDLAKAGKDWAVGTPAVTNASGQVTTPATGGLLGTGGQWEPNKGWLGQGYDWLNNVANSNVPSAGIVSTPIADLTPRERGGRLKRAAGGGMPYSTAGLYGEEDIQPTDPLRLKLLSSGPSGMGGGSGPQQTGFGSLVQTAGQLGGLASGIGAIASLFNRGGRTGYQVGGEPADDDREAQKRFLERARPPQDTPAAPPVPDVDPAAEVRADVQAEPPVAGGAPSSPAPGPPGGGKSAGVVSAPQPSTAPADPSAEIWGRHWQQESGDRQFRPDGSTVMGPEVRGKRAVGRSQIYDVGPEAAKLAGVEWDPNRLANDEGYNRLLGNTWAKHLQSQFQDPYQAVAAYNSNPETVRRAIQVAAVKGGQWWQYLPDETKNHLWNVSQQQIGAPSGGGRAVALNTPAQAGAGMAGPAVGSSAGLVPQFQSQAQPDWWDRNEKYVIPALSFLGSMLASPSRTFAGAFGSGLVGAARSLPQQQELAQGQQRIDIANRGQLIGVYNQLLNMRASQIANGRDTSAIDAQISRIAGMIGGAPGTGSNAVAGAGVVPTGGLGQPSSGIAPAAPAAPAQGLPAPTGSSPPTAAPPANDQSGLPPSMRRPALAMDPAFLSQLADDWNPQVLMKRAADIEGTSPAQAAAMRAQAYQVSNTMMRQGWGLGKDNATQVPLPNFGDVQAYNMRLAENPRWQEANEPVFRQRQMMRENVDMIAKTVQDFETGATSELQADFQRLNRALGIRIPSTPTMNAEAFQTFMKEAAGAVMGNVTSGVEAKTDAARELLGKAFATPTLEPGTVRNILAQTQANLDWADQHYNATNEALRRERGTNRPEFTSEFSASHPLDRMVEERRKRLAVAGDAPDDRSGLKDDYDYMLSARDVQRLFGGDPQFTGHRKFRASRRDGKVTINEVR